MGKNVGLSPQRFRDRMITLSALLSTMTSATFSSESAGHMGIILTPFLHLTPQCTFENMNGSYFHESFCSQILPVCMQKIFKTTKQSAFLYQAKHSVPNQYHHYLAIRAMLSSQYSMKLCMLRSTVRHPMPASPNPTNQKAI